jgi:hypothetical protein
MISHNGMNSMGTGLARTLEHPLGPLVIIFVQSLSSFSPRHKNEKDIRGWGDSTFSMKATYLAQLDLYPLPP